MRSDLEELRRFTSTHIKHSIRNTHDAEDLIQEMQVVYLDMAKEYKELPKGEFVTVAKVACRNKVRDYIRKKSRFAKRDRREVERHDNRELDRLDAKLVLEKLKALSDDETSSIMTFMERGLEQTDIMHLYNMSRSTLYRKFVEVQSKIQKEFIEDALHRSRIQEFAGTVDSETGFAD